MKKAKEYLEYFKQNVTSIKNEGEVRTVVLYFIDQFLGEFDYLKQSRNVQTVAGIKGIIKELQDKWRSLSVRLEKHYGESIIQEEGFINYLKKKIPITHVIMDDELCKELDNFKKFGGL